MKKMLVFFMLAFMFAPFPGGQGNFFRPAQVSALDFKKFTIKPVPPVPVYMRKKDWIKWCWPQWCGLRTSKPGDGMLGLPQFAASASELTKMYDWDYKAVRDAFVEAYAVWSASIAKEKEGVIIAQTANTGPGLALGQKLKTIEHSVNIVDVCHPNPLGYIFTQSSDILEKYIGFKEGEDRNLGRGVSENLVEADRILGAYASGAEFVTESSFDSGIYNDFRYAAAVMAGRNRNPRPKDLDSGSVQDARYLTNEARLSIYRSVMNEPWRQYEASRLRIIPFKLLKDWFEDLYKFAMTEESEKGGEGGAAGMPEDSNSALTGEPTMVLERCKNPKLDKCRGGEPGKAVADMVALTVSNPPVYALVQKYCAKHGMPVDVIAALIGVESSGGRRKGINNVGAAGIGQHKPPAMKEVAEYLHDPSFIVRCNFTSPECDPRKDPEKSVEAVVVYFKKQMMQNNNDVLRALIGYNRGPGNLQSIIGGRAIACEGEHYSNNIVCIPGSSIQNGVTLIYNGSGMTLNGDPIPLTGAGKSDEELSGGGDESLTEEEYQALLKKLPKYDENAVLSQEEVFDYLSQFFASEAYTRLTGAVNAAGALKLRFPVRTMRYFLLNKIREGLALGQTLDGLADIPDYNASVLKVNNVMN